jgi:hypothetical protein
MMSEIPVSFATPEGREVIGHISINSGLAALLAHGLITISTQVHEGEPIELTLLRKSEPFILGLDDD